MCLVLATAGACSRHDASTPDPAAIDASTGSTATSEVRALDGRVIEAACKGDTATLVALSSPQLDVKNTRDEITVFNNCEAGALEPLAVIAVPGGVESRYAGPHELRLHWKQTRDGLRLESVTHYGW